MSVFLCKTCYEKHQRAAPRVLEAVDPNPLCFLFYFYFKKTILHVVLDLLLTIKEFSAASAPLHYIFLLKIVQPSISIPCY